MMLQVTKKKRLTTGEAMRSHGSCSGQGSCSGGGKCSGRILPPVTRNK